MGAAMEQEHNTQRTFRVGHYGPHRIHTSGPTEPRVETYRAVVVGEVVVVGMVWPVGTVVQGPG